VPTVDAAQ
jgi:hypothetical protein